MKQLFNGGIHMKTYIVINPKTGDSVTREFTPCQLSEVVRDGYTIIVPLKTAVELASKPF